jgi:excisionase family DNA binding protein
MDRLLTIREAAALLRVREQTLYLWVSQKRIAHRKNGRLVRFTESDLQSFIDGQRQLPDEYKDEHL